MRAQFEVPHGIYLLNHSVGCMPKRVAEQLTQDSFWSRWQQQAALAWPDWMEITQAFRRTIATLLHNGRRDASSYEEVCPQPNVSSAVAKVIGALPQAMPRGVMSTMDFPSVGFAAAQGMMERVHWVRPQAGRAPIELWEAQLDPQFVQWVVVSHATYGHSVLNPVRGICALARERGILSVVDVTQSAGIVPIEIDEWRPDCVVGSSIKWLCGGSGAGFLWVNRERLAQLTPRDVGWFSHAEPFAFDIESFEYAADARRFWGGTPSIGPCWSAQQAIEVLLEIGIPTLRAHNQSLTEFLRHEASAAGFTIVSPSAPDERGGTLCVGCDRPEALVKYLTSRGIHSDARPHYGVRFSPHLYNTWEEMAQVAAALRDFGAGS